MDADVNGGGDGCVYGVKLVPPGLTSRVREALLGLEADVLAGEVLLGSGVTSLLGKGRSVDVPADLLLLPQHLASEISEGVSLVTPNTLRALEALEIPVILPWAADSCTAIRHKIADTVVMMYFAAAETGWCMMRVASLLLGAYGSQKPDSAPHQPWEQSLVVEPLLGMIVTPRTIIAGVHGFPASPTKGPLHGEGTQRSTTGVAVLSSFPVLVDARQGSGGLSQVVSRGSRSFCAGRAGMIETSVDLLMSLGDLNV